MSNQTSAPAAVFSKPLARDETIVSGFAIEVLANTPELTMLQAIDKLLQANESYINSTIHAVLPPGAQPVPFLQQLSKDIHALPHDVETTGETIYYLIWLAITIIFVGLRFYARKYVSPKEIRREDWACFAALLAASAMTVELVFENVLSHTGHHIYDLKLNDCKVVAKLLIFGVELFIVTHFIIKLNFLIFYYRLNPSKTYQRFVWAVGIYCVIISIPGMFVTPMSCRPFDYWNHYLTAKCIDRYKYLLSYAIELTLADFFILLLPIYPVLRLKLKTRDKILLVGMFSLGGFITVTSILRMISLKRGVYSPDWTYDLQEHARWIVTEQCLSVIISTFPAIKVLFYHRSTTKVPGLSKLSFAADGMFKPNSDKNSSGRKTKKQISGPTTLESMGSNEKDADSIVRTDRNGSDVEMALEPLPTPVSDRSLTPPPPPPNRDIGKKIVDLNTV